jgi:integrase/recombinase XerD
MAKKKRPSTAKPPSTAGDTTDPEGFARRLADYVEWMSVRNYSPWTAKRCRRSILHFIRWCDERGLHRPKEITRPILERYARHLYYHRKENGQPLTFRTQHNHLSALRSFFKHLTRQNHLLSNPASEIELPRLGHRLPKAILTKAEMEQVLSQPDVDSDLGVRDRAILETFYSTGIRRMELTNLSIYDLDVGRGTLIVRQGKGKKDRVVPIGERALDWIDRYITDVRPTLVVDPNEPTLFLTAYGEPISNDSLSAWVTRYVDAAAIGKKGSCHLFRHTMATLMLEAGADVRFIQEMLGHQKLDTTQLYTQVSIRELKRIHELTHPSAKRGRHHDETRSHAEPSDAVELLDHLDAEADEELDRDPLRDRSTLDDDRDGDEVNDER